MWRGARPIKVDIHAKRSWSISGDTLNVRFRLDQSHRLVRSVQECPVTRIYVRITITLRVYSEDGSVRDVIKVWVYLKMIPPY
jgi:hypothetical protein